MRGAKLSNRLFTFFRLGRADGVSEQTANAYLPRGICEQPPLKQREFTNLLFAHPPLNFGMALKRAEAGARRIHEHQVKPALLRKRQLASRIKLHQIDPRLIE